MQDEKSPILQVPGSVTYACVMGGMVMLALLALQSAWLTFRRSHATAAQSGSGEVAVPHW